jgi:hypothetical protein
LALDVLAALRRGCLAAAGQGLRSRRQRRGIHRCLGGSARESPKTQVHHEADNTQDQSQRQGRHQQGLSIFFAMLAHGCHSFRADH